MRWQAAPGKHPNIRARGYLDLARAETEYERSLALAPNDTDVLMRSARFTEKEPAGNGGATDRCNCTPQ